MVIVSPADIILQEGKDTMNSTCALGPRHNLFGGGIVSTIDSWHQIQNRESDSIKQESSPPRSQDSEGSPYSSGNEMHTGYYASYEDTNLSSKEESNNNNNNTSPNQTLIPSEGNDGQDNGRLEEDQSKAEEERKEEGDALMRLQLALQRAAGNRQLQCPYCSFITTSRPTFELHLQQSHEDQRTCALCDFSAETSEKLLEHVRETHPAHAHSDNDVREDEDEPGLAVPKINSQGKVKTFRCKQCDFSAVTKLEFWEHTRSHIKQERLLTCPRCPFVTEYKHHLEYHLRNHFGSKPFKCDKCSYSCVNKSMLNSHLKSHSNVYQFSCADCNYATKYCHSLKLHLRKYDHKPAMVLNPDGSPNPLPIIDVYGTRRGPKMKHSRTSNNNEDQQPSQTRSSPQHISSPLTLPEQPQQQIHQPQTNLIHPLFASAYGLPYYNPLLHPLMYGKAVVPQDTGLANSMTMVDQQDKTNFYFNNNNNVTNSDRNRSEEAGEDEEGKRFSPNMQVNKSPADHRPIEDLSRAPLDLSRWDSSTASQEEHSRSPPPRIATERRRKGKAYKLETLRQERTSEDDEEMRDIILPSPKRRHQVETDQNEGELPLKCVLVEEESSSSSSPETRTVKKASSTDSPQESYNCNYCDITFRDVVMYTMHMGYHGYGNPYTCNMCGETTTDRVSFFLHIARTPHS